MKLLEERAAQAIKDGYTYCVQENFEDSLIYLSDIVLDPSIYIGKPLILCEKESSHMTVSGDTIAELIMDHIYCQDEFYSEDWDGSLKECDSLLQQLSDKINSNLSKKEFYFPSDIEL